MIIHRVSEGETVFSIADLYGISVYNLLANNGFSLDETLVAGQTAVIIYPTAVHTVQSGETLLGIARSYGLTLNELYRNNPQLGAQDRISPGEELFISYEDEKLGSTRINGYAYEYVDLDLLRSQQPYLTYLSPFTYGFTPEGNLIDLDDGALINIANQFRTAPLMHLSTLTEGGNFSNELAHDILNNEAAQDNLIEEIVQKMNEKGFRGLDIDFEFLPAEDNLLYPQFIAKCRSRLNPLGYIVITALAPKTSDEQKGLLYEGHLYREIGEASDAVFLMTYEWGYTYGPPMAVAPIQPVRKVIEYALSRIPSEKILMGIPNYGYDWTLPYVSGESRARSISNVEAVDIARRYGDKIEFDNYSQSPHFNYMAEDGREHEVWFEDAESIRQKLLLINEYQLMGAGYWNLMRPFRQNWTVLNNLYNIIKENF